MPASVNYHCSCLSSAAAPPPPHLPSSSHSFHPLHTLFFCEECDAVRCNRCVSVEVSGYYCPNCLFEVPSASVRAEKNRCARNCFLCPHCRNTLSVVPSDPPDAGDLRSSTIQIGTIGEPPFFLYCNNCRWDSAEVGITFEKPTGLALQLQKTEDSAPDSLEFERLKEHFEPVLRASSSSHLSSTAHPVHINPITAAASSALARDIPGVSKYNAALGRSRAGKDKSMNKDEMPEYRSRVEVGGTIGSGPGGEGDVDLMRHLETPAEIAKLEQRWVASWSVPLSARELKPLRIPLHSKPTKRCPSCRHILIKPEQKAQSVRYKIKLVAANYLPAITAHLPHAQAKRPSAATKPSAGDDDQTGGASGNSMNAGKTYPFQLALTNPLYDPIHVRLNVQRHHVSVATSATTVPAQEKARRPPFAVSLPTSAFPIAAFAEAWEYEDDEEMFGEEDEGNVESLGVEAGAGKERGVKGRTKTVGILERKANVTVVGGEVVIGKEGRGDVKFNMLVSYTYRSDDPAPSDDGEPGARSSVIAVPKAAPQMKTFSFYTVVDLGVIIPKEESRVESEV